MKKVLAILLVVSSLLTSLSILNFANASSPVVSTGILGSYPVSNGSVIAFLRDGGHYYFEGILYYYDIQSQETVNTGITVSNIALLPISISGSIIALSSLNRTICYYDISTGTLVDTNILGMNPSIDGSKIAFYAKTNPENWYTGRIMYYDIVTESLVDTGIENTICSPSLSGSTIAFNAGEWGIGLDLNGDGDVEDNIAEYYDMTTGTVVNTGFKAGGHCAVAGDKIAFSTSEYDEDMDLNGDGLLQNFILQIYDVSSQTKLNTGIIGFVNASASSGPVVTYISGYDSGRFMGGYYNTLTGLSESFDLGISPMSPTIGGTVITFFDRDFQTFDKSIQYIDISKSTSDTQSGIDVTVSSIGEGITLTFPQITEQGTTTISTTTTNPGTEIPSYQFLGTFNQITTTASFNGPVTIAFSYDPNTEGLDESTLKVFHWDGTQWADVTYSIDLQNHIIYAQTVSFSTFAIASKATADYVYSGVLQPVNVDGTSIFKLKSTIPVKFQLYDIQGNPITSAQARIYLAKVSNGIMGTELEAFSTSAANTGNLFRYDGSQYIFNLGTKDLSTGTWQIRIALDDGTSKYTFFSLK
jgi:hypothetical protein